jgi:hypothetical protein
LSVFAFMAAVLGLFCCEITPNVGGGEAFTAAAVLRVMGTEAGMAATVPIDDTTLPNDGPGVTGAITTATVRGVVGAIQLQMPETSSNKVPLGHTSISPSIFPAVQ